MDIAAAFGEADEGGVVFLSFARFRPQWVRLTVSCNSVNADRNRARLSFRFPNRAGCSRRIEFPERWVAGARPVWATEVSG